ncbi:two-component system response regulator GlnR [Mariniluteicoccus endophyticus]
MADVLLLTPAPAQAAAVLPSLALLGHTVRAAQTQASSLVDAEPDVVLLDARTDLVGARDLRRTMTAAGITVPVVLVVTDAGLPALSRDWAHDFVLAHAGPAEVDARIRLAAGSSEDAPAPLASGGVEIDEAAYAAKVDGRVLDLTYTEFELLRYFVAHPGRVFSREQLLSDVWGYDYYGGTRTVDVHVRRLRAKLGESDGLISTVRNVGYRFG